MKIPCKDCITLPVCINTIKNAPISGVMSCLSDRCSIFNTYCEWGSGSVFKDRKIKTLKFFKIKCDTCILREL